VDAAFGEVMRQCAARRAEGTWITPSLIGGYVALHELGWAHSVEVWAADGSLAGGLYGVAVGAMFGAESMFHLRNDASKVAMAALVQHAHSIGVELIDIQVLTEHTERMGGVEISRDEYLWRLRVALEREAAWAAEN
jgi:leucyl/phenylalanyl-tRNA--protein transferase